MSPPSALGALARPGRVELAAGWVDPGCALCGARARRTRFLEAPHAVVQCSTCGLVYVTPRRSAGALLAEVYDESYWRSARPRERGYADYLADQDLCLATFRRRFDLLAAQLGAPGRALDLGCAAGFALCVLRERGWQVSGIEPSAHARAAASLALGAQVLVGETLDGAPLAPDSFDLITLWDVLEHLPDPLACLRRVRELLAPGGRVVIETQDVCSRAARLLGRRWQHYKHAEHLHHFSQVTLTRALQAAGLQPLAWHARGGGKYVRPSFLVERSARLASWMPTALAPWARLLPRALWVDLGDELLVVAGATGTTQD